MVRTVDTPEPEYPDTMRRLGDNLPDLMAKLGRVRAAQARANERTDGRFRPDAEEDTSPRTRQQAAWAEVVRGQAGDLPAWRLANLHLPPEVTTPLARWVEEGTPVVVLVGCNGAGKTRAAAATLHAAWRGGSVPVLFRRASDLVEAWLDRRGDEGRVVRDLVARARFAVVDDLGRSPLTDVREAAMLDLWDRLADGGCRLIVTTNLNAGERTQQLGQAMASRLGRKVVRFPDTDLRDRNLPTPPAPPVAPCQLGHGPDGALFVDALPDAHERIMGQLEARGIRPPLPDRYPHGPAGDAMLAADRAWYEGQYDHAGTVTVWCPHCWPERQPATTSALAPELEDF